MAWSVYERTPGGSAKTYLDPDTGEVVSARQYRNMQEANRYGFATLSAMQNATKMRAERKYIYSKTNQQQYHLSGVLKSKNPDPDKRRAENESNLQKALQFISDRTGNKRTRGYVQVNYRSEGKLEHRNTETFGGGESGLGASSASAVQSEYEVDDDDVDSYDYVFEIDEYEGYSEDAYE